MKRLRVLSSVLTLSFVVSTPIALAHVGHGDEFQAEGGVDRVEVNAETDPLLGIQVNPIEPAADGSETVMIPVSALVEDTERQLVFVLYENFYEPVPVMTGESQGEMIEILEGLSVGEQLVTQGSLSLYAESRKTQTADAADSSEVVVTPQANEEAVSASELATSQTDATHDQAHAQGIPHSHDESSGLPLKALAAGGGGIAVLGGVFAFVLSKRNQKEGLS